MLVFFVIAPSPPHTPRMPAPFRVARRPVEKSMRTRASVKEEVTPPPDKVHKRASSETFISSFPKGVSTRDESPVRRRKPKTVRLATGEEEKADVSRASPPPPETNGDKPKTEVDSGVDESEDARYDTRREGSTSKTTPLYFWMGLLALAIPLWLFVAYLVLERAGWDVSAAVLWEVDCFFCFFPGFDVRTPE